MTEPGSTCVRWLAVNVVAVAMGVVFGCKGYSDTVSRPETVSPTSRSSPAGLQTRGSSGDFRVTPATRPTKPAFERILEASAARGIEILPVLVTHPDWAAPESLNYSRGYAIGFNFASRYRGRFTHIEAGNELDNRVLKFLIDSTVRPARHHYYEGALIEQYVDTLLGKTAGFLRGMTEGIHHGAPGTKVIINAGWRHYAFFEALHRGGVPFDVYGYHWYSEMEMGSFAAEVLAHLPDPDKEIWITEANRRGTPSIRTTIRGSRLRRAGLRRQGSRVLLWDCGMLGRWVYRAEGAEARVPCLPRGHLGGAPGLPRFGVRQGQ